MVLSTKPSLMALFNMRIVEERLRYRCVDSSTLVILAVSPWDLLVLRMESQSDGVFVVVIQRLAQRDFDTLTPPMAHIIGEYREIRTPPVPFCSLHNWRLPFQIPRISHNSRTHQS